MARKLDISEVTARAKEMELVVMDVDGVLTDGRIILTSDGEEAKCFNVKDGHGIVLARIAGLKIAWVSGRFSEVTSLRAKELGISNVIQGELKKLPAVEKLCDEMKVPLEKTMFIGDDVVDIAPMKAVGLAVAVADAVDSVIEIAHWVTSRKGGDGAVREVLDIISESKL